MIEPVPPYGTLTSRETEILEWVMLGYTAAEIGEMMFLSDKTIKAHKTNIHRKLRARSATHAVAIYLGAVTADQYKPISKMPLATA